VITIVLLLGIFRTKTLLEISLKKKRKKIKKKSKKFNQGWL